jgi:hypothetical protein
VVKELVGLMTTGGQGKRVYKVDLTRNEPPHLRLNASVIHQQAPSMFAAVSTLTGSNTGLGFARLA